MEAPAYRSIRLEGIVQDVPPAEAPNDAWTGGYNVHFRNSQALRSGGWGEFRSAITDAQINFLMNVITPDTVYWIYCYDLPPTIEAKIHVNDGVSDWDITPAGGLKNGGIWTGGILNGVPVLNNQLDPPVYWDLVTSSPCQTLPGWPSGWLCGALRVTKYHLIAMNISKTGVEYPDLLAWSESAQPGTLPASWTPAPSNDAGDTTLSETMGPIIDGAQLRDTFIAYKRDSTYMLQYVAGDFVFNTRLLFASSGIQSQGCMREVDGAHYVLTANDVIRHDGQSMQSLADRVMRDTIISGINKDIRWLCEIVDRQATHELWICIPETEQLALTAAFILNMKTGKWGIRRLPDVYSVASGIVPPPGTQSTKWDDQAQEWDDEPRRWKSELYSDSADGVLFANNAIYEADRSNLGAGADVPARLERQTLQIGNGVQRDLVTGVIPDLVGRDGDIVNIRIGGQAYPNDSIDWADPVTWVIGETQRLDLLHTDRFISIELQSTNAYPWALRSLALEFGQEGKW